jgi:predicted carbohydrate-binding protein with CBM5 and CBM33 domain
MPIHPDLVDYARLVHVQLHSCRKALDALQLEVPAAHLEASIDSLQSEILQSINDGDLARAWDNNFDELDEFMTYMWTASRRKRRR